MHTGRPHLELNGLYMDPSIKLVFYLFLAPFWLAWQIARIVAGFISNAIHDVRTKKLLKEIDDRETLQKQQRIEESKANEQRDQERVAKMNCSNCGNPVGSSVITDLVLPYARYCSLQCEAQAREKRQLGLEELQNRMPTELTPEDDALLIGKTSGQMYFERGRCVRCGHALSNRTAHFSFCSPSCRQRSFTQFMQPVAPLENDYDYQQTEQALRELEETSEYGFRALAEERGSSMTYDDCRTGLTRQKEDFEFKHKYKTTLAEAEARAEFVSRWQEQRAYILEREKEKENTKIAKEREKLEAAEALRIAEEERWRPKPFNV